MLDQITNENNDEGARVILYGEPKAGKTTLACSIPNALLIPTEAGYTGIKVDRLPVLTTYEAINNALEEIKIAVINKKFEYKTIVIDSLTAIESIILRDVVRFNSGDTGGLDTSLASKPTIDTILGGFGRGQNLFVELFKTVLNKLEILARKGKINVVCTCHVSHTQMVDPIMGEFDAWDLALFSSKNKRTPGNKDAVTQWADLIGFLHQPSFISESNGVNRVINNNKERQLGVAKEAGYLAGNRYGLTKSIDIPATNGWEEVSSAVLEASGINI